MRFGVPPAPTKALSPLPWQGPSPLPLRHVTPRPAGGPKPPASARPAHGGRWPLVVRVARVLGEASRAGEGNAVRFGVPPGATKALSPLPWQGPSPLPQRHADPWPAGGPKPPASARPAPGGRFSPAGSGAGLPLYLDLPVYGEPSRTGGGNAVRFLIPPAPTKAFSPLQWQGPSPLPQHNAAPCQPGAKAPGPRPPRPRRALACIVLERMLPFGPQSFTGGGNAEGFRTRPERGPLSPGSGKSSSPADGGMQFQHFANL